MLLIVHVYLSLCSLDVYLYVYHLSRFVVSLVVGCLCMVNDHNVLSSLNIWTDLEFNKAIRIEFGFYVICFLSPSTQHFIGFPSTWEHLHFAKNEFNLRHHFTSFCSES